MHDRINVLNNPVNTIDPYGLTAAAGTGCMPGPGMQPGFWPGNPIHDAAVSSLDSLLKFIFSDQNIIRSLKLSLAISGHGTLIYLNEGSNSDSDDSNPNITTGGASPNGDDDRDPSQDKRLSKGEIKKIKKSGYDIHDLKPERQGSRFDLFKDRHGNIYVKPKNGSGPGDPTGLNINNF